MVRFLLRAVFAGLGLWIASALHIVAIDNTGTLVVAAILLGLVNAFVRPVVVILTLPITLVTLGLFLLVVNALMIGIVDALLGGFKAPTFMSLVLAAIVTGIVSWIGHALVREERR